MDPLLIFKQMHTATTDEEQAGGITFWKMTD